MHGPVIRDDMVHDDEQIGRLFIDVHQNETRQRSTAKIEGGLHLRAHQFIQAMFKSILRKAGKVPVIQADRHTAMDALYRIAINQVKRGAQGGMATHNLLK